ncbi:MAG TPA: hypothetical protein VHH88_05525 [Verrucomicrobiae bacterium]|nr:hypothetical protein [Verrucomicrobiae bacterium]
MKVPSRKFTSLLSLAAFAAVVSTEPSRADQIEMTNGDHYVARVVAMTNGMVVLDSSVLGTVAVSRAKVASIHLGVGAAVPLRPGIASHFPAAASVTTPAAASPDRGLAGISGETNLIQQVQKEYLADSGPAATAKFNELLAGLQSGKISLGDLRKQAQTAADQLKQFKKDLGPEADETLDGYLSILESFLRDTPASESTVNTTSPAPAIQKVPGALGH